MLRLVAELRPRGDVSLPRFLSHPLLGRIVLWPQLCCVVVDLDVNIGACALFIKLGESLFRGIGRISGNTSWRLNIQAIPHHFIGFTGYTSARSCQTSSYDALQDWSHHLH